VCIYFFLQNTVQYKLISSDWSPCLELHCNTWIADLTSEVNQCFGANKWWTADSHVYSSIIWLDQPIFGHQLDRRFDGRLAANWEWKNGYWDHLRSGLKVDRRIVWLAVKRPWNNGTLVLGWGLVWRQVKPSLYITSHPGQLSIMASKISISFLVVWQIMVIMKVLPSWPFWQICGSSGVVYTLRGFDSASCYINSGRYD